MISAEALREARDKAGLSAREAAALVGVTPLTWQRWEGQSSRTTEIPYAHWNLFLLLTGSHPIYRLEKKMLTREQVAAMNADKVERDCIMQAPTQSQIEEEAKRLAVALGSGVHLHVSAVMQAIDLQYPGLTEQQFADVREQCAEIVQAIRADALSKMWA